VAIVGVGRLAPTAPAGSDVSSFDAAKLTDAHLYLEFQPAVGSRRG
jgi:hypothetical protein